MKLVDRYGIEIDRNNPPSMVYAKLPNTKICIHKIHGCGDGWYLSCHNLQITDHDLKNADFEKALENAKEVIANEFSALRRDIEKFIL